MPEGGVREQSPRPSGREGLPEVQEGEEAEAAGVVEKAGVVAEVGLD